jgi:hypothetical protein
MKKLLLYLISYFIFGLSALLADEGMWLLPLLEKMNIDKMTSMGLKLSAEDIYSINHSSLKDAVVVFGGFCTAEIVSAEGLLLTNHHCGFEAIQNHSTVEHDYLKNGFWAANRDEELPNPELSVSLLIRMEDVSFRILANLDESLKGEERNEKIRKISREIEREATEGNHYKAIVKSFFNGNNYYLLVYEQYNDVRLVGAPPSSIGKFGYDTDNWVWPRHTGDFSVFRIYTGPDGKPADYSPQNIPLKPRHYFPISLKGYDKNDFTMVIGYPGNTIRYISSFEVDELMGIINPNRITIRGLRQEILLKDMQSDEKINIQYASKYSRSSNYWKYSIGQLQGLKRLKIYEKKQQLENTFNQWINADEQRKEKYGNALKLIQDAIKERRPYQHAIQYTVECLFTASEIISFAGKAVKLYDSMLEEHPNQQVIDSLANELKILGDEFYNDYSSVTDAKVTPAILKLYYKNVPEAYQPVFFNVIKTKYKGNINKYTEDLFKSSVFSSYERFNAFICHPSRKILEKDKAFVAAWTTRIKLNELLQERSLINVNYDRGQRLYMAGLMEMQQDKIFYPDANSTMRLTYGTVQDYYPRDAVHYDYYTTLDGIIEKEDPGNFEFIVPDQLKTLYNNKDFGEYGIDSLMPVCFITDNDITGGNSGSPVLDSSGNLIGIAFDGNWEAMSGDIIYEPKLQRCICVDIRYVLFIIDKYAGARHLINEMKIIK